MWLLMGGEGYEPGADEGAPRAWDLTGGRLILNLEHLGLVVYLCSEPVVIVFEGPEQAAAFFNAVTRAIRQGRHYLDAREEGLTFAEVMTLVDYKKLVQQREAEADRLERIRQDEADEAAWEKAERERKPRKPRKRPDGQPPKETRRRIA